MEELEQQVEVDFKIDKIKWLDDGSGESLYDELKKLSQEFDIDRSISLPRGYLSTTQVEAFLRCPKQFEFRYIKDIKSPPSGALIQGSGVHTALEVGYNIKKKDFNAEIDIEETLDAFNDYMNNNFNSDVLIDDDTSEELLRKQGENIISRWYKDKLPYVYPKHVEKPFIAVMDNIPVVGIIDLIDQIDGPSSKEDVIVDNKTTGKRKTQAEADSSLQLTLYSAVSRVDTQRLDVYVRPRVSKKGLGEARLQELYTYRSYNDILWLHEVFSSVAKAITTGVFPPTSPGNWTCSEKWCGYWHLCRGRKR